VKYYPLIVACAIILSSPVDAGGQVRTPAAASPLPVLLEISPTAFTSHSENVGLRIPYTRTAQSARPFWLLPLLGAASGALLWSLAVEDSCADDDCMIGVPPFVTGTVIGAGVGVVLEIAL
jgi:hypothetical protein